jgi:hypothetical protein
MATQASILPMSLPPGSGSRIAQVSPENPQMGPAKAQWMQLNLSEDDIRETVRIVSSYRNQWTTGRLVRMRIWMKNVLMYRNIQVLDWHEESGSWVDSLSWYQGSNKVRDGESTGLEKYIHPVTLMLGQTFIGNMSREVPLTVVRPQDARVLADLTTAAAAQDAIGIIERRNRIRQMVRGEFEFLYLYGSYFKYTRGVLDGRWSGYDTQPIIGEMMIEQPAAWQCMNCGKQTPVAASQQMTGAQPGGAIDGNFGADLLAGGAGADSLTGSGQPPACSNCGKQMGEESYMQAGPPKKGLQVLGMQKIPRAMVKQSIHSPLEIDADPQAKELEGTPILAYDYEIDIGEVRQMFPDSWDLIAEGQGSSTTANADYERLRRSESYAMGTAYTTDTEQQRPTYSQVWVQPMAYSRGKDKDYVQRMTAAAPDGLKLTMVGSEVVGVKQAVLVKEWTLCRLHENFGLYSISIAENVVTFNERFNSAMQLYDDYMMRAACGLNLVDASRIDTVKWQGNTLAPATVVPVPMKFGAGDKRMMSEAFMHFDIPINPGLALYPQMLWQFAQLLNGMPPQISGSGTNPDVETYGGQNIQLSQANTGMAPYWENVKEEHAMAAQNSIECLQELLRTGAAKEIWDVVEDQGAQFRNNYVNLDKMKGRVRVYPDEDQDLPQTVDQMRESFQSLMDGLAKQNPAAAAIFDVPANQEIIARTLYPGVVSPIAAQRAQTLQDLNTLLEKTAEPIMKPDGSIGSKLPVEPSIVWDYAIVIPTISEFMIENADLRITNPVGWSQCEQYLSACQDMQTTQGARKASLELKVKAAGMPPPPQNPAQQGAQAALQEILQKALDMVNREAEIAHLPPQGQNGNLAPQVSAANNIVKTAIDTLKVAGGK